MAGTTSYHTFKGTCKFAQLYRPNKFNKYSINLYPDKKSKEAYIKSGCQSEFKEDDDGSYITLRRNSQFLTQAGKLMEFGPPVVTDAEGNAFDKLIGNGSTVEITVATYDTGKGKGTRLDRVKVLKHVEYVKPEEDAA